MTHAPSWLLLDTASLYFRAFFAVPESVRAPDGSPVNAARGLMDIIATVLGHSTPTHIAACWDDDWRPQWRVDLVPSYKAHRVAAPMTEGPDREEVPPALTDQLPLIRQALETLGIPVIGAAGYEADDVIGTLAGRAPGRVDIVTGDRDLYQLIDDRRGIRVLSTVRGMARLEMIDEAAVQEKYGITAAQYADFATLRGDASDGLPGVKGIGEKTAATLLREHGDLDAVRAAAARGAGMTATMARRVLTASAYLDAAAAVVRVATDLQVSDPAPLAVPGDAASELGEQWGLGSAMERVITALTQAAHALPR